MCRFISVAISVHFANNFITVKVLNPKIMSTRPNDIRFTNRFNSLTQKLYRLDSTEYDTFSVMKVFNTKISVD